MKSVKDISYKLSKWIFAIYFIVAIMAPFLAGDKPIYCYENGKMSFPMFSSSFSDIPIIKNYPSEACLWPLIPFSPTNIDHNNQSAISPFASGDKKQFQLRHWLGTDKLGRDVAAGMIHGTVVSLKIGVFSVFFTFIIGVSLGIISAYYRDDDLSFTLPVLLINTILFFGGLYYLIMEWIIFKPSFLLFFTGFVILVLVLFFLSKMIKNKFNSKKYAFPLDLLLIKLIEIRKSFPGIFILLSLVSLFTIPSLWNIIFIISLLGWTEFARFARAETLAVKGENFILSAKVLGFNDLRIIIHHILPNILPTLMVIACFSMAGAILLESTLSFLGIGLPVEEVTWGKMMAEGRNMKAWWLVVFPGLAIFLLILSLNTIASGFQKSNVQKLL